MNKPKKLRAAALLAALLLGCTTLTGCADMIADMAANSAPPTEEVTETTVQELAETIETTQETEPTTEGHVSPQETVTSYLGTQFDTDVTLDRDSADDLGKNYKVPLQNLIREGDIPESFTFVFYASDGNTDIGTFKGGCGVSVTEDCTAATDAGWYQSEDLEQQSQGAYIELKWNVPANVAPYIAADGDVQVGYWWGNTQKVILKNVICTYTRTESLPVDGTKTVHIGQVVRMTDGADKSNIVKVPLSGILGSDGVPQAITFDISGSSAFHKFTGAFGITTDDWYQSDTIAVMSDASTLSMTWILPEEIRWDVPRDGEVMLGYWWSEAGDITLDDVTVKYSVGGTRPESPASKPDNVQQADNQEVAQSMKNDGRAAAIAADIKVGWNLGNTLDCYDKTNKNTDYEVYWGNPKTTKALFDTVKAKGFNAVRIPVSWTNHLSSDNTIDTVWLDRVQQVVDYALEDDLYVIINMHHDDYTWLHPVYAEEDAVSAKYVKIWKQIAARFKDYDLKLLFEGLNEPRMVGTANEWMGGTDEERTVINHLLAKFVDTVRTSGGNNADRTLLVPTHAASITDAALNGLVLPDDSNLIVSIHNYSPWKLTTKDYPDVKTFDATGQAELDAQFDKLDRLFVSKGIPVIITEFGAESKDNDADRDAFYAYYIQSAGRHGIPCFLWDNGPSDSYGILDRKNNAWFGNGIADAVVEAAK